MIEITDISIEEINCIKELWEELNKIHYKDSVYFKDHYNSFTFERRIEKFTAVNASNIKISVAKENDAVLGYCISTKEGSNGEIDSLFTDTKIRGQGIGKQLLNRHVEWLKENGCSKLRVAVSYGHESAVKNFYNKAGFYERMLCFELKDNSAKK